MKLRTWITVAVATLGSGCGVIDGGSPSETADPPSHAGANVYLNACDLLDKPDIEAALGAPVVERLLAVIEDPSVPADDRWGSCDFEMASSDTTPGTWTVQVNVDPVTEEPAPITSPHLKGLEPLEGVGAHAAYLPPTPEDPNYAMILAVTPEGVSLLINFETSGNDPALREKATALARAAATNASKQFPGDRRRLPRPTAPPVDLCTLISVAEQVKALGWAPTSEEYPTGSTNEYAGEPGGGMWECVRARGPAGGGVATANLTIRLTKESVPEAAWQKGAAVPALGRGARLVRSTRQGGRREAAILLSSVGGRRLTVSLWDDNWDAARHEAALVALARVARDRAGQ